MDLDTLGVIIGILVGVAAIIKSITKYGKSAWGWIRALICGSQTLNQRRQVREQEMDRVCMIHSKSMGTMQTTTCQLMPPRDEISGDRWTVVFPVTTEVKPGDRLDIESTIFRVRSVVPKRPDDEVRIASAVPTGGVIITGPNGSTITVQ